MRGRGTAARPYQSEPWAADVEGVIRSTRLPARGSQFTRLLLAADASSPTLQAALIGAVGSRKDTYDFAIVALARDVRVAQAGVGDDMLADFDSWCRTHADGRETLELAAAIHVDNLPAQRLAARNGWEEGIKLAGDRRYAYWGKQLQV